MNGLKNDIAGVVGVCLVTYGLWLVYQPAAYIFPGCILIFLAVWINDIRRDKTT